MKIDALFDVDRRMPGRGVRIALLYSILLFSAAWFVWALCMPLLGDDAVSSFRFRDYGGDWKAPLRYAWGMWNHCNGRTGDYMSPIWTYVLPRPATALLVAVPIFLSLWGILRLSTASRHKPLVAALTLALGYALLPWYDLGYFVCHFNYVWGTAWVFPVLAFLFARREYSRKWLWCLPLAFLITASHEAMGFPLGVALVVYWFVNRGSIHLQGVKKWWVIAMLAGAVFCVSSPASYQRAAGNHEPDLPIYLQLLETLPSVLLLVLRILWLWYKGALPRLSRTRWLIFAVAAFVSSGFTLIGGIAGRAGWYAQWFALTALAFDFSHAPLRLVLSWKQRNLVAMVVAIGCNIFAVCYGLHQVAQSGERQTLVACYRATGDREAAAKACGMQLDDWAIVTLPIVDGKRIEDERSQFIYEPLIPLYPGDKNPTDPYIELN